MMTSNPSLSKKTLQRRGQATEPLRKLILFLTPLRLVQLAGFVVILAYSLKYCKTNFFLDADNYFYDIFLRHPIAFKNYPGGAGDLVIQPVSVAVSQGILFFTAVLSGIFFIPFRKIFSVLSAGILASLWIFCSYLIFSKHGIWTGVAIYLVAMICFLMWSLWIEIMEYERKLSFYNLAVRDPLTGLYLVGYMSVALRKVWRYSKLTRKPFAVILLEVDEFRKLNDHYGYRTGDEVLKKISEIINDSIRTKGRAMPDLAGRYGPGEFILLLSGYDLADAVSYVAERIRKTIKDFVFQMEDGIFFVSVSTGISVLQLDEEQPERVVERAQEALLKAKEAGKNQISVKET